MFTKAFLCVREQNVYKLFYKTFKTQKLWKREIILERLF